MTAPRSRSALPITEAELRLMANAAIMGDNSQPVNGYSVGADPILTHPADPILTRGWTLAA